MRLPSLPVDARSAASPLGRSHGSSIGVRVLYARRPGAVDLLKAAVAGHRAHLLDCAQWMDQRLER